MTRKRRRILTAGLSAIAAILLFSFYLSTTEADLSVYLEPTDNGQTKVIADRVGAIYETEWFLSNLKEIPLAGSTTRVLTWTEHRSDGNSEMYAISISGKEFVVRNAEPRLRLRAGTFDPIREAPPSLPFTRRTDEDPKAYIVQFVTQPLEEYRQAIKEAGGRVFIYVADHAHIVQMDEKTAEKVAGFPFVRWVGHYEPGYKIDHELLPALEARNLEERKYNVMVLERGGGMHRRAAERIEQAGGIVHNIIEEGFRLETTLDASQLLDTASSPDILYIDPWFPPEDDMDIVRTTGGANNIEALTGYRGEGVRAEVMDNGLRQTHSDFQSGSPPLIHNSSNTNETTNHGTSTYGIVFGRGTANAAGRGLLPEAQGIFADYDFLANRYTHTARLGQPPYNAVFQSNSWGNGLTVNYTTISAELDDIIFINDILILHSQSNTGTRSSRPQAWSKNVVSVGGIYHYNNTNNADDRWAGGASIGPAADGRMKPDLANYYDAIFATSFNSNTSYTSTFGGTSAATPITAGHFGIFYQMWHNSAFDNPTGPTVFESRPHAMTAKAVMINTAMQWDMSPDATDIRRENQGFGRVSVDNLYALREKMLIVDGNDVLNNLETKTYLVTVAPGSSDPLKITLAYIDPMGNPAVTPARINDLDLKVTAPDGTTYWGNNGLAGRGMWSQPGDDPNKADTVENVFIETPIPGVWRIDIIASELNQDANPDTPDVLDARFSLIASGISLVSPTSATVAVEGRVLTAAGRGLGGVTLTAAAIDGEKKRARTNTFGYFRIEGLRAGETYIISAASRGYSLEPSERVVTTFEDISGIVFTAGSASIETAKRP